ncbi:formate dehydrogenase accessory sulfurtransferase FdhD [Inhella sp.]|uniref:formate dehydrogenase accessory sulfurtransferase FdhD n=1 Tax=Inhella sp. TaxID=1921806 RepID=UPI0035AFE127
MPAVDPLDWARPAPDAFASGQAAAPGRRSDGQLAAEQLVEEAPVTLVFNDEVALTLMATPLDAEALALGFCLSEGLVEHAAEILDLQALPAGAGLSVLIQLPEPRLQTLRARRRLGAVPGGCGLCGIEDQRTLLALPARALAPLQLAEGAIESALVALPGRQALNSATGGAHAAAFADPQGELLELAEDVSRHCALDKLIGRLAQRPLDPAGGFALLTSRASFELVHKAARVGLPCLVTMSAPTALALRAAQATGLQLFAFARPGRWTRYHP